MLLSEKPGYVLPVVEIESGIGPHSYKGVFLRRYGSSTRAMTTAEVQDMFVRREEILRRMRMLIVELLVAREAALAIGLVTQSHRASLLRHIDTRMIAELHASVLPLLSKDEELSEQVSHLRAQAEVLNFKVGAALPLFYAPRVHEQYAKPKFDAFIEANSDAHTFSERLGVVVFRLCELADLP